MNLRFIDWIWHVRGSLVLTPGQSNDDVFNKLAPLFRQVNTNHKWADDTLTFDKRDQAAQDKMSVFDSGTLRVERGPEGPVLRYHMVSRALLYCFLAPLLFLGFAQIIIANEALKKPATEAAAKTPAAAKKPEKAQVPMHPIDQFLGAPKPEKPKAGEEGGGRRGRKPSPTPAYVFAGIFATLWAAGRILEDRLVRRLFKKSLSPGFESRDLQGGDSAYSRSPA